MRIPPKKCDSALHEFHRPLPIGSVAVHCRTFTDHCPPATWERIARIPLPTAATHCGIALQSFHCSVPPGNVGAHNHKAPWKPSAPRNCGTALHEFHCPLP